MIEPSVSYCVGIVTYNPELGRLRDCLASYKAAGRKILIFDNGSRNQADIEALLAGDPSAELVASATNLGIAAALNSLAERAISLGFTHMLQSDQDSVAGPRMVETLAEYIRPDAAIIAPRIIDRNKLAHTNLSTHLRMNPPKKESAQRITRAAGPLAPISSGALVSLRAWAAVGGHDDRLFTDYVDYEFNARCLVAGYRIYRIESVYLFHEAGHARPTCLRLPIRRGSGNVGFMRVYTFGHPARRCYFKGRNRVIYTARYIRKLGIHFEGVFQIIPQLMIILLFEEDRWRKSALYLCGMGDGLREAITEKWIGRSSERKNPNPSPRMGRTTSFIYRR